MKTSLGLAAASLLAVTAGIGCNDGPLVGLPGTRTEIHQQEHRDPTPPKVDLLWVIDDSGSMADEQGRLAESFQAFADRALEIGLDLHLAVTSADPTAGGERGRFVGSPAVLTSDTPNWSAEFVQRALLGTGGNSREAGLQTARMALSEPLLSAENAGFRRPGARLALVFLSDEDDQTLPDGAPEPTSAELRSAAWRDTNLVPVAELTDFFSQLDGDGSPSLYATAIVGDPVGDRSAGVDFDQTGCETDPTNGDHDARGGFRYAAAVAAFGGGWHSICGGVDQFRAILEELADDVAPPSPLRTEFALEHEPLPGSLSVTVDGVDVPDDPDSGWSWVPGVGVVFSEAAIPPSCARIEFHYRLPPGVRHPPSQPHTSPGCS